MQKFLSILLSILCILTLIGCNDAPPITNGDITTEAEIEQNMGTELEETPGTELEETLGTEATKTAIIFPLPSTIDLNNIMDCTLAVAIENGGIYASKADSTIHNITVKVYDYEVFDLVDISLLEIGSVIMINNEQIEITSIERNALGTVIINGGLDVGGYELVTNDSGIFYSIGYSDAKTYFELGEVELELASDFTYIDASDLDNAEKKYTINDLSTNNSINYSGTPHNTSIVVENGVVTSMKKIYTP